MLGRNDEARKVQMSNKFCLLYSVQVKKSISGIMIQSIFQMYKMTKKCGFCYANNSVKEGKVSPNLTVLHN